MKIVLDSEEGIQCDSSCNRWFHRGCVDMTKQDYTQYSRDTNKKWNCNRVDCKSVADDPIVALTTSVNKLMNKIDNWSDKIDKIESVSVGVAAIKSDISEIKEQISKLEPRVTKNEANIATLTSKVDSLKDSNVSDPESIITELNDRNQRAKNAIVHGIPESNSKDAKSRILFDKKSFDSVLQSLSLQDIHPTRIIRIGQATANKPRPVKVTFKCVDEAITFFKAFDPNLLGDSFPNCAIDVSRDRTPSERSHLQKLRATLETRTKAGETNLVIKYQNGTPSIIAKKTKN